MPQRRPKYKRSCLNISTTPTIAEDAETLHLPIQPPRRRRASSCSSPGPDIVVAAPTPSPTPASGEQKPQQVRKRATEPDLRKYVVVSEATRVYNVYGRVYLDGGAPFPQPEDSANSSELVDYNEQVFLVMKARRRMAARANRRARKPLQVAAPQCMELAQAKAGSTTAKSTTTVNVVGDEHSLTVHNGDYRVTASNEPKCPEQQEAEKLDEVIRSIETMALIPDAKGTTIKCFAVQDKVSGARIHIGKDLRLTAEMLSVVAKDRQWVWIRRWVDMLLQRLGELYDAVYEANLRCSNLCYGIASSECDIEFARQIKDTELEVEARRVVESLKARRGDAAVRRERVRAEAGDKRQLFEYYYRDLMISLGHPRPNCAVSSIEENFDPSDPFKSFSYAV